MGTRADFYIGKEWLGSVGWDGYPEGISEYILSAQTRGEFKGEVMSFLLQRDDATFPKQGWPWPWNDSNTTDYAYVWDGRLRVACFGSWINPETGEEIGGDKPEFPDMSAVKNITWGTDRGGVMIMGSKDGAYNGTLGILNEDDDYVP